MSDPFQDKDYGDYFKLLEEQIHSEHTQPKTAPVKEAVAAPRKDPKKTFRVRPGFLIIGAIFLILLLVILLTRPSKGQSTPSESEAVTATKTSGETETPSEEPIVFRETKNTRPAPSQNDAEALIMVRSANDEIVLSRNAHQRISPASTTKIMTILVAAENAKNYEDTFEMTREIADSMYLDEATVAGFSVGESVTITDLLYGTILPSGGDAAIGLAVKLAGSEEKFVELMNQKAKALGLKNTHFTNVTGLYDPDHYSSAYDMAIILKRALQHPVCKEVLSTYQYTTSKTAQHPDGIELSSTLFSYMYGTEPETATILGGKTGYVDESGYCIASYGTNNETGNEYITVTMKNSSRWPAFYGQIDLYKEFAK